MLKRYRLRSMRKVLLTLAGLAAAQLAFASTTGRVAEYFASYDPNHDGRIERAEWIGRGNFDVLDTNRDGIIDLQEFSALYENDAVLAPLHPVLPASNPVMDGTVKAFEISSDALSRAMKCAISRARNNCEDGLELAQQRGLIETGISPVFPEGLRCQGVDESYAMSYTAKREIEASHGGIDIPADFDVPILAVAAGTVVGIFDEADGKARGRTLVIRHTPEDTGLPFWVYTEYAHFNDAPKLVIGQRVRMGEVLGPTGNSGNNLHASKGGNRNRRRPAIHFAVYYAQGPQYALTRSYVVPENGYWMDPIALFRKQAPFDSQALRALPEKDKFVMVSVMAREGAVVPENAKLIWPYPCTKMSSQ